MPLRVKTLIAFTLITAACGLGLALRSPSHSWLRFAVYLSLALLSSGLKVPMPKGEGTASVNFPFILLGIVQLSPAQAIAIATLSVLAQCRFKVLRGFTLVQIAFNLGNATIATSLAWLTYSTILRLGSEMAPALAVAAIVYFLANTIPVSMAIGWSQGANPMRFWAREFPWYLPFYLVGAILAAVAHLVSLKVGWTTSLLLVPVIYTIYRAYQAQRATVRARERHLEDTEALHLRTIEGLAMAIEAKDHGTHDHLLRVRVYVSEIGAALKLDKLEMQALVTASFLHDIGKLAIPEHILNKPGKLTKEEFEKIKTHPQVGAEILERVRFPYPVVPIVRAHHESWDGTGYPDGLKGEEIPIGARILTVVDCFDALASDRPYRRALPAGEAMAFVKSKAGTQFDPRIVEVLEQRYIELEQQARIHDGEIAPLSTEISVERGEAPGAGFQSDASDATAAPGSPEVDTTLSSWSGTPLSDRLASAVVCSQEILELSRRSTGLSASEMLSLICTRLSKLLAFDCIAIYRRSGDELERLHLQGEGACHFSDAPIGRGEGLSGWVAQNGTFSLNGNPTVEPNYLAARGGPEALACALGVPLFEDDGEVFGALTIYSFLPNAYSREDLRVLQCVENRITPALGEVCRRDVSTSATNLDDTKVFFLQLEAELQEAQHTQEPVGVVLCRLIGPDGKKPAVKRLERAFREHLDATSAARLGADESAVVLIGPTHPGVGARLAAMQAALANEDCLCSVGASFYPADGDTPEALLATATRRMYLQASDAKTQARLEVSRVKDRSELALSA